MGDLYALMRPLLFALPPEFVHKLSLIALRTGIFNLSPCLKEQDCRALQTEIAGLQFQNPVGMAAGFDKNADIIDAILNLGFGHTEIGTVTPRAQTGNARPRLFRLAEDKAIINRMGFNNRGHAAVYEKLAARLAALQRANEMQTAANSGQGVAERIPNAAAKAKKRRCPCCYSAADGLVGVNIGVNKDSADKLTDYRLGLVKFYPVADYFAVNISSPNTPGLRDLHDREKLRRLLALLRDVNAEQTERFSFRRPIFLKLSPDLTEKALDDIAAEFLAQPLDGIILTNTTISRPKLLNAQSSEAGGLSGCPLFTLSTIVLAKMRQRLGKAVPLIGVGGICDSQTALAKIAAGADMVQIYSGLIYQGAWVVPAIIKGLSAACRNDGVENIRALRDSAVEEWAKRSLDIEI